MQFNSDHKSSSANSGLPVYLFLLLLLLRVDLLKYSRSLYGLINIMVLQYDPVLLEYWNTGILSSIMGHKMYIRSTSTWYWYAALKPCNTTMET